MNHFRTLLLLSLAATGCGSTPNGDTEGSSIPVDSARIDVVNDAVITPSDILETKEAADAGGSTSVNSGGASGDVEDEDEAAAGSTSIAGSASGGPGDAGDQGGSGGAGGSSEAGQGGSAGTDSASQGGTAGTAQGGTGGSSTTPPPPACTFDLEHNGPGTRCTEQLLFEACTLVNGVAQYDSIQCGTAAGWNCDLEGGCGGNCLNGAVQCTGNTAETCVSGAWETTDVCGFQCVNGACEGSCTPGNVICDGASVVTCGSDFHYGNPVACPGALNAAPSCSGAGVCGTTCTPGFDDCTAAAGCESDLSNADSCGSCGIVCPGAPNATRTCNGGVCGLTPIACSPGTADCGGDWTCETPTSNDPLNCGGCGISCYGGTCSNGSCSDTFEVVSDFSTGIPNDLQTQVLDMIVGAAHVYWWTNNQGSNVIRRAPKAGGTSQILTTFSSAQAVMKDNLLLLDGGLLYWVTSAGIYRMPEAGGTPVRISTMVPLSLAISAGKLYWNDSDVLSYTDLCIGNIVSNVANCNATKVVTFYTLNLSTLALTQWTTNQYEYGPVLGVVGNELFVTRFMFVGPTVWDFAGSIRALHATTGVYSRIISDGVPVNGHTQGLTSEFGQAVFAGTNLIFTAGLTTNGASLCVAPLDQAQPYLSNTFVPSGLANIASGPEFLAADATHAYLAEPHVESITLDGTKTTIFNTPGENTKVAVDSDYVYWSVSVASTEEKAILRANK